MDDSSTKRCTKCSTDKPLSEFEKDPRSKLGHRSQCKACRAARWRERYATEPDFRERNKQRVRTIYATDTTYREGTRQRVAEWQREHRERVNAGARQRYHAYHGARDRARRANPSYRARKREWERLRLQGAEARARSRWSLRQGKVKRRTWLRDAGTFTRQEWNMLCARYDHCCLACGASAPLTVDHVIPLSKGGTNMIENIQPLCRPCNSSKGTQTIDYRPRYAVGVQYEGP
jgi:5-methylcytosine-specific restriction endonuclease McrA